MVGARVRSKEGKGTGEMRVGVEDARQLDRQTATQAAIEGHHGREYGRRRTW